MNDYLIIGNGVAAVGCIEGIRSVDRDGRITVVSQETHPVYCRPLISYYLEGKTDLARMQYRDSDFYEKNGCRVLYGKTAVSADPSKRTVTLDDGSALAYTSLCIAAGSAPFVPPIAGLDSVPEALCFMTLDDALALERATQTPKRVLIVGAGLIGLKCAEGLHGRASSITVCDLADHVLPSILDADSASILQSHLERNGVRFLLTNTVERFDGQTAHMKNGETIEFDVLVLAVGVRANTALAKACGCETNRGVLVSDDIRYLRRGRLRRGHGRFLRAETGARHSAERLYAGLHGGREHGRRHGRFRQRHPHERHRVLRSAYHDGGRLHG